MIRFLRDSGLYRRDMVRELGPTVEAALIAVGDALDLTVRNDRANDVPLMYDPDSKQVIGFEDGDRPIFPRSLGVFKEAELLTLDTTGLALGAEAYVSDAVSGGSVKLKWNGRRFIPANPVTVFASGAGWTRVLDGTTDTTRVVLLAVKIPRILMHENTVIRITHSWVKTGAGAPNRSLTLGINDTSGANTFYNGTVSSGNTFYGVQEITFINSMIYPQAANMLYAAGQSANAPAAISVDMEQEQELLFYNSNNGMMDNTNAVTLRAVKVEVN